MPHESASSALFVFLLSFSLFFYKSFSLLVLILNSCCEFFFTFFLLGMRIRKVLYVAVFIIHFFLSVFSGCGGIWWDKFRLLL